MQNNLNDLIEKQKELQERLGYDFNDLSLKEIAEFWIFNKHAFDDEFQEMMTALGGERDGIGNAVWKRWKKHHNKADQMKLSDLSTGDLNRLKYEVIDALHFFLNFAIAIGMNGKQLYELYMIKNDVNHERQNIGY